MHLDWMTHSHERRSATCLILTIHFRTIMHFKWTNLDREFENNNYLRIKISHVQNRNVYYFILNSENYFNFANWHFEFYIKLKVLICYRLYVYVKTCRANIANTTIYKRANIDSAPKFVYTSTWAQTNFTTFQPISTYITFISLATVDKNHTHTK